jgi:RHS repeat-associated protein
MKSFSKILLATLGVFLSVNTFASYTWSASYAKNGNDSVHEGDGYAYKKVTDPNGNQSLYVYQYGFGEPRVFDALIGINKKSIVQASFYDSTGRLIKIKQLNQNLERQYNYEDSTHLDWLTSQNDPELGKTTYTYYPNGLRETEQTEGGSKTLFTYNANDQVKTISYEASSDNNIAQSTTKSYEYDANGNNTKITLGDQSVDFDYDPLNELLSETLNYNTHAYKLAYYYNQYNDISNITYPDGFKINFAPNPLGNASQVKRMDNNFSNVIISNITYSSFQMISDYVLANTQHVSYSYDPMGRIDQLKAGTVVDQTYQYDGENNVLSITDNLDNSKNESFGYDVYDRLINAKGPWGEGTYQYDDGQNITLLQVGNQSNTYTYNANNLLTNTSGSLNEAYVYDKNGNVIQKGNNHYLYDAANHLIHFSDGTHNIDFMYDPNGHVISTKEDDKQAVITIYDQSGQLMYKEDPNTNTATDYIYLKGKLAVKATHTIGDINNITYHYIITNPLGSPIASITNTTTDWVQTYQPFGIELKPEVHQTDHIGFTGKETVKDMNLVNMNARYYAPNIGRFMAFDAAPPSVDNVFSFNRYAYGNNNPLRYIDPTGLSPDFIDHIKSFFGRAVGHLNNFASGVLHEASMGTINTSHKRDLTYGAGGVVGIGLSFAYGGGEVKAAKAGIEAIETAANASRAGTEAGISAATKGVDEVEQLGGKYGDIRGQISGNEVHHMPADSASPISRHKGPGISMSKEDHSQTASYKNIPGARDYRGKQSDLISQGKFKEAQQMDINDVRSKFGNKYDGAIAQMEEYTRTLDI